MVLYEFFPLILYLISLIWTVKRERKKYIKYIS